LNRVVVAGVTGWGSNSFGAGSSVPNGFAVRDVNTASPAVAISVGTQKPSEWFIAQPGNKIVSDYRTLGLNQAIFTNSPNFLVNASAAESLTKGGAAPAGSFFQAVDYIGAFKATDWTAGWAEFNPQAETYR